MVRLRDRSGPPAPFSYGSFVRYFMPDLTGVFPLVAEPHRIKIRMPPGKAGAYFFQISTGTSFCCGSPGVLRPWVT